MKDTFLYLYMDSTEDALKLEQKFDGCDRSENLLTIKNQHLSAVAAMAKTIGIDTFNFQRLPVSGKPTKKQEELIVELEKIRGQLPTVEKMPYLAVDSPLTNDRPIAEFAFYGFWHGFTDAQLPPKKRRYAPDFHDRKINQKYFFDDRHKNPNFYEFYRIGYGVSLTGLYTGESYPAELMPRAWRLITKLTSRHDEFHCIYLSNSYLLSWLLHNF